MELQNPMPWWIVFLSPLLSGGYLLALRISQKIVISRLEQYVFSFALFAAMWLITVMFSSLLLSSFIGGLTIGTTLLCIGGMLYEVFIHKKGEIIFTPQNHPEKLMFVSGLAGSTLIFLISIYGQFHDELLINGHRIITAQLQNDFFPPRNILNPSEALRYHFGFDVFCAALTGFTRCSINMAIDISTTISFFYCWICLWLIGGKLFKYRNAGLLVASITLFGGGLAPVVGLMYPESSLGNTLMGLNYRPTDFYINPPLISYLFQHPFGAGLPLTCSILLLLFSENLKNYLLRFIVYGLLFLSLYFCQTVLFITLLFTLSFYKIRYVKELAFIDITIAVLLFGYLSKMGLLFTPVKAAIYNDIGLRFWPHHASLTGIIEWYTGSVGLLLLFGIGGLLIVQRKFRPLFFFLILLTAGMPLLVNYKHTSDIVKFIAVANFYLGIISGGMIAFILSIKKTSMRAVGYLSIVLLTVTSVIHLAVMIHEEMKQASDISLAGDYYPHGDIRVDSDYAECASWIRLQGDGNSMLLSDNYSNALGLAINSGLPTIYNDNISRARAFGLPEERRMAYSEIYGRGKITEDEFKKLNIRWLILSEGDSLHMNKLLYSYHIREVFQNKTLKLYEYINVPEQLQLAFLTSR